MNDNEWQAFVTSEAARAAGAWLESRGGLHRPIRTLTMADLEAIADAAISRFVVLASGRIQERQDADELRQLLLM